MSEVIDFEKCGYLIALKLFRTPFGNQPVKVFKTLPKSAGHHFYANVLLISKKLSCVSCLLVRYGILRSLF